jgi:catechol 2,3-dioxygenase-like lactoylglutathione lyase family enzyme
VIIVRKATEEPMAITGVHALLYTPEPEALRATLRDVFGWSSVDAGGGWLIFAMPPAEVGVHPSDTAVHQLSLMCDDLDTTMATLRAQGIEFVDEPSDMPFGRGATMRLPGDVELLLYQPRHATAI